MNTTILAPSQMSLPTGFSTGSGVPPKRVILKPAPGTQGATARLALLPQTRVRFGAVGASIAVQATILAIVILIPLAFPEKMIPKIFFNVMPITAPMTEVPVPPEPKPIPVVRPKPVPVPVVEKVIVPPPMVVQPPKIIAPRLVPPKVQPKIVAKVEAPKIDVAPPTPPAVDVKMNAAEPVRPRAPVQTGLLSTGSAAPATINKPVNKVQTGGFGDANGMAGPADPNKRANINGRGSLDLPNGPGYGNGTGGANGARGTVASTGFGNGTAIPPASKGGTHGAVQQGAFSPVVVETEKPRQQAQAAAVQPIEILEKPKPEYTAEARALKIEGDVVVQVVFKANGEVQIVGVAQSLGHGLDEMAVKAAQKIKYKAAISNGRAVDFPARVRIEFQLAY